MGEEGPVGLKGVPLAAGVAVWLLTFEMCAPG